MGDPDSAKQVADLMQLIDISRQMGVTFELDPLLKRIELAALQVLDCERASVFLYDPERRELFSKIATGVREIRFPSDRGIAGEAAQTRRTINVPDAYADPRFNPSVDRSTGYRTRNMLTLSMVGHDGQLVGVLQLLNKRRESFTPSDERLAETLSALAGVAVQRQLLMQERAEKQRLERELDLAKAIQRGCLPDADPHVDGFDIAGWNKPADQTGGDAYDFIATAGGQLGLLIADATGHGIGPALMVAECRAVLRVLASMTTDLEMIMTKANSVLVEDLQDGRFVTVCLAFLDPHQAAIQYLSAGHAPLIQFLASQDTFVQLPASTLPLGITNDFPCRVPPHIRLGPQDLFILVTDGFLEWTNPAGEQFGTQRLFAAIRASRGKRSAEIIADLHQAVRSFASDNPQVDDLTAILVQRTGPAGS